MLNGISHRLPPSRGTVNFILAQLYIGVNTAIDAANIHTAKHLWELCLAEQMRKLLRSSDLSVPGSRQHKVWTSYLHTPIAWAERKASWFTRLPASQSANTYLDLLDERYRTMLGTVLDGWESNDFAEMVTKDGKATLDLSKDEKLPIPATVEPLREAMLRVMPHARLADVLIEVDDWVGLRGLFTHLNERESAKTHDPRVDVALFAALLAHGLNLPLSTMAEATDIPYHELTHVSDWYVRGATRSPETLEKAGIGERTTSSLTKESMRGAIPLRRSERLIAIALP